MTGEKKIILGAALVLIALIIVGVFALSKSSPAVVKEDVITRQGLHWHPKLSIYIKGEKKELEDGIGIGAVHLPIHTHTEDYKEGVIHMEMQGVVTKEDTKLQKFFQTWGKQFNSDCIFDKCNGEEGTVKMFVNGVEDKEFENYLMKDGDNIEIRFE